MKVKVSQVKGAILTTSPEALLVSMKARMAQKEPKGKIKTWECDAEGDFRYLAQQYDGQAWVRPVISSAAIHLKLVWPDQAEPLQEIKAIFIGRFIEMVAGHFVAKDFSEAKAFPLA